MFGIGVPELVLILALALIVLGPDKLPQVAKQIARFVGELKRASEDFKKELEVEGLENIKELKEMADLKNPQTWKKNFDRLVDLDSDPAQAHPLAGTEGNEKSDLPGGLGPEWQVAKGGGKDADSSKASEDDVINPEIDYSHLESTSQQGEEGAGSGSKPQEVSASEQKK